MGNNSTKESRPPSTRSGSSGLRHVSSATNNEEGASAAQTPAERVINNVYSSRSGRGSRHDLSFLRLGGDSERDTSATETRRETKQEREARKAEKERVARENERERSMREEGVDGGYLVTLGTYTGPEDFNKSVVRQLMIERRLAPFWKGLNDHSNSWTEHQLVAAAKGLPIPAADEIPPEMERTGSQASNPRGSDLNVNSLMVPIASRSQSYQSDTSANLSASHPAFSKSGPSSPIAPSSGSTPLFRGRAKTLASLTSSSKNASSQALTPQEIHLPKDPYVNGQFLEAYLYKDSSECPICFLYYPPYLNRTRCCDQPICSECFVQIKRPDPHPPEHHDDPNTPSEPRPPEEEGLLVSEPSACPFCVTPEFGVTYDPPPFRRGLAYANQGGRNGLASATSAMSSTSSLTSNPTRRRTTSLSASAPTVITTDRVRPDWAKKLADARAHALRRSAAATALHNAAYVLGNQQPSETRGLLGRRRRTLFGDSPSASGSGTPRFPEGLTLGNVGALLAQAERQGGEGSNDTFPGRSGGRRTRMADLEELMMMEAIRLSLAAEEDRKKKEEKEAKKEAKKREKEARKAEKAARKTGSLYPAGNNESTSTWASMARSSSNLGQQSPPPMPQMQGKGKAPASALVGFNPLSEPTSTLNTEIADSSHTETSGSNTAIQDPQRHLEESRANLQQPSQPIPFPPSASADFDHRRHLRQVSTASSAASSVADSTPAASLREGSSFGVSPNASGVDVSAPSDGGNPGSEPMFNFRSLAAMIGEEEKAGADHVEHVEDVGAKDLNGSTRPPNQAAFLRDGTRSRGDSGESSSSAPPPTYVDGSDEITPANAQGTTSLGAMDQKHYGDVRILNAAQRNEATQ